MNRWVTLLYQLTQPPSPRFQVNDNRSRQTFAFFSESGQKTSSHLHARNSSCRFKNFVRLSPKERSKEWIDGREGTVDLCRSSVEHFRIWDSVGFVCPRPGGNQSNAEQRTTDRLVSFTLTCDLGRFEVMLDMSPTTKNRFSVHSSISRFCPRVDHARGIYTPLTITTSSCRDNATGRFSDDFSARNAAFP